jgi:hypothetical protein
VHAYAKTAISTAYSNTVHDTNWCIAAYDVADISRGLYSIIAERNYHATVLQLQYTTALKSIYLQICRIPCRVKVCGSVLSCTMAM